MVRQQGRCRQTGLPGLLQTTGTSRASIQGFNISSSLYRHILTQYPRCSFSQLAASCGKCFECGTDGANTSQLVRSKLQKGAWYCGPCSKREVHNFCFFSLFLSTCPTNIYRHDNFLSQAVSSRLTSFEFHILRRSWTSPRPRGRTCVTCGTDTTDTWYRCKDEPGTKICVPCYDKNRRNNTKAASANET